ncbi:hypothetical protein [Persicitalea jodogahamensis]|uniref:Uncharacterized protein n=1 Tax=Persicitalea jodogahamensis TaxID=402147 RepID=A0A8J3D2Y3_9BACT|nr:hypothetical protein [Persicitalea jodogahamensis]GHB73017.1 hypothetical protein GCM10007390_28890 [Persicitalea jodogahamensis]
MQKCALLLFLIFFTACRTSKNELVSDKTSISGIYPHLAYYNNEGECGTGAVVPWAGSLWVVTYGPHFPYGSSDKLYEITDDLKQIIRPESTGGTPADRMIHRESNQLFIGPHAIDKDRNVRTVSYKEAPGRYTGLARHLTDPANKILLATMEEGFYEVDVKTLKTKLLYTDGNVLRRENDMAQFGPLLPGAHGKGYYSGQGVAVYSNNGEASQKALKQFDIESGALAEWDGKEWKVVRRNQFVEVTGPGGIYGNANPATDPIWATGWDHKSVLLGVRDAEQGWSFFRLPKASHSYDGAHGWNTEWPRIRDVGTEGKPDYLMTMHGMFWKFPQTFTGKNTAGIRPRSAYLKVIGDYARWNDRLVFGCDDSAQKEFLNTRKIKGDIGGPGQSNSNLWFTSLSQPDELGPSTAQGAVWLSENVEANTPSDPFLFAGWDNRMAWVKNEGTQSATFAFEVDKSGNGDWQSLRSVKVEPGQSQAVVFEGNDQGEWVRVKSNSATKATVNFNYHDASRFVKNQDKMFTGLTGVGTSGYLGGHMYGLGDDRRALGLLAGAFSNGKYIESGYYELDSQLNLVKKDDPGTAKFIREKFAIPKDVVHVEASSVLIVDDSGRRWRLPLGDDKFTKEINAGNLRIAREVATERDLLNAHGTFYELPAENADGFAKIRPVASHSLSIHDYASYRGLLVMTGLNKNTNAGQHIVTSADGQAKVWVGAIDDLWKLGKPVGHGGPWNDSQAKADIPSDPYLIGFYDQKSLQLTHKSSQPVTFQIQVNPIGHGPWMTYKEVTVKPGETFSYSFPKEFEARWIRFAASEDCTATAWLKYE